MIIDERFTRPFFKLCARPAPQRLDFLRGSTFPSIFGHTETSGHRILEIHTRREHRFCQNAKTR